MKKIIFKILKQIKENYIHYSYFSLGFFLCTWIFYNRLLRVRLPRDLEFSLSLSFLCIAILGGLVSLFHLWSLIKKEKSFGRFEKIKGYTIYPLSIILENAYLAIYRKTLAHPKFPGQFYLDLFIFYKKIYAFCQKKDFWILFSFYFFPKILLSFLFFLDVVFFHRFFYFYLFFPLFFVSILFHLLFLKALFDFGMFNAINMQTYIKETLDEENQTITYELTPDYRNHPKAIEEFEQNIEYIQIFTDIIIRMGTLDDLWKKYKKPFEMVISLFYFLGWVHIVVYYFFHFWVLSFLFLWIVSHITLFLWILSFFSLLSILFFFLF